MGNREIINHSLKEFNAQNGNKLSAEEIRALEVLVHRFLNAGELIPPPLPGKTSEAVANIREEFKNTEDVVASFNKLLSKITANYHDCKLLQNAMAFGASNIAKNPNKKGGYQAWL